MPKMTLEQLPIKLRKLLEKTPHCLLFEGPKGSRKEEYAETFARLLLKTEKKIRQIYVFFILKEKGITIPFMSLNNLSKKQAFLLLKPVRRFLLFMKLIGCFQQAPMRF